MKLLGTILAVVVFASADPTVAFCQSVSVKITSPRNGAVVPQKYTVRGDSSNVGRNKILLFVYAPGAAKWFYQDTAEVSATGSWQGNVVIGAGGDVGYEFRIAATVMAQVPQSLSDVPSSRFPLPGTLAQSEGITVKRGQ